MTPQSVTVRLFLFWLAILSLAPEASSQMSAAQWFQAGLKSQILEEKIRAFENAVRLDPDYMEAYYFLGLAYKKKGRLSDAVIALNKAYFKTPYALSSEVKARIQYELGTIFSEQKHYQRAIETLENARSLTANKVLVGKIDYSLGKVYLELQDFDRALEVLNEGKQSVPRSADLFDKLIAQIDLQLNARAKYHAALSLYARGKTEEAAGLLREVVRDDPSFTPARTKLREVEDAARRSKMTLPDRPAKRTTKAAPPRATTPPVAEKYYQEGISASRRGDWRAALEAFQRVRNLAPDYKDVAYRIGRTKSALQRQQQEQLKSRLYSEGLRHMRAKNWQKALTVFGRLQKIDANYRDVATRVKRLQETLAVKQRPAVDIESLFQKGLRATENGEWSEALSIFEQVRQLQPDYKDLEDRLADVRFHLQKERIEAKRSANRRGLNPLVPIGLVLTALTLPVLGILIAFPNARARFYLLQGKYDRAARVYEKIIARHPDRVYWYPVLANIYLLANRRDEKALQVFEKILELNLYTRDRERISSIVANYYLKEGRTDEYALDIMEKALHSKLQRLRR